MLNTAPPALQLPEVSIISYNFTGFPVPMRASINLGDASSLVEPANAKGPARWTGTGVDIAKQTASGAIKTVQEVLAATTTAPRAYLESRLADVAFVYISDAAGSIISTSVSVPDPPPPSPTCRIKALNYYLFFWEDGFNTRTLAQTLVSFAPTMTTAATITATITTSVNDKIPTSTARVSNSTSIAPTTLFPSGWSSAPTAGSRSVVTYPLTGADSKTTMATFTYPTIYLIADITTALAPSPITAGTRTTIAIKPEDFKSLQFDVPPPLVTSEAVKALWSQDDGAYLDAAGAVYAGTKYNALPVSTTDLLNPAVQPYYLNPWLPLGCGTRTREAPCKTVYEADYTPVISLPAPQADWKACGAGLWPAGGYTPIPLKQESFVVNTITSIRSTTVLLTETTTMTVTTGDDVISCEGRGFCLTNSLPKKARVDPTSKQGDGGFETGQQVLGEVSLAMPEVPGQTQVAPNSGNNKGSNAQAPLPNEQAGLNQEIANLAIASLQAAQSWSLSVQAAKSQSLAEASKQAAAVQSSLDFVNKKQADQPTPAAKVEPTTTQVVQNLRVAAQQENAGPQPGSSLAQPAAAGSTQPAPASTQASMQQKQKLQADATQDVAPINQPKASIESQAAAVPTGQVKSPGQNQAPSQNQAPGQNQAQSQNQAPGPSGVEPKAGEGESPRASTTVPAVLVADFNIGTQVFTAHQVEASVPNQDHPAIVISVADKVMTAGGAGVTLSGGQRVSAQMDGAIVADDRTVIAAAPSSIRNPNKAVVDNTAAPGNSQAPANDKGPASNDETPVVVEKAEALSGAINSALAGNSGPSGESPAPANKDAVDNSQPAVSKPFAVLTLSSQTLTAIKSNDAIIIGSTTLAAGQALTSGGQVIQANSVGELQVDSSKISFTEVKPTLPAVVNGQDGNESAAATDLGPGNATASADPIVTIGSVTFSTQQMSDGGLVIGSQTLSLGETATVAGQKAVLASNGLQMESTTLPLAMPYMTGSVTDGPLPTRTGGSNSSAGPAGPSRHLSLAAMFCTMAVATLLGAFLL